jgi:3',5'-cyclic-AMP phosphodiesterase
LRLPPRYRPTSHCVAHVSDSHLLADHRRLYGLIDSAARLAQAMSQLERCGVHLDAIVFTGDLADAGEAGAYARVREIVEPVAARMGAQPIWVMGNHDDRVHFSRHLLGRPAADPQVALDEVHDVGGLRIVSLDTTVPGYHHGDVSAAQLRWLADVLGEPAPHGTLLALHHPPMPVPRMGPMEALGLANQARLEAVVRGSDVRAILAGHLHHAAHSTFAGIPLSVAASTCYTLDTTAPQRAFSGRNAAQAVNLVHIYAEQIVHQVAPVGEWDEIVAVTQAEWAPISALGAAQRHEMLADKESAYNQRHAVPPTAPG